MDPNQHHNALNRNDMLHWYEIQSILGQGGFGITYLARDTNLDQLVAIKEYLPSEFSTRDQASTVQPISENHTEIFDWGKKRFLDEAKTLAQFRHPNVVRVSSFFENNNTGYMVMEYEDGTDLSKLIKAGESFDEQRLLSLLLPVLDGLDKIHAQGFIHRDIKPANIFIRTDGSPVLIDFGSARQAIGEQTKTMTSLVTPGYAPFEQYHDAEGKQGPWTDIYSLGATCYCMLTGKPPMDALKRGMARLDHSTDAYLPLVDLRLGDYSERVLQAIDHALEFKETDRPQSVSDWSAMLCGEKPVPQSSIPTRLGVDAVTANDGNTQVVTAPSEATRPDDSAVQAVTSPEAMIISAPPRAGAEAPAPKTPVRGKSRAKSIGFTITGIVLVLAALGWYSQQQKSVPVAEAPTVQDGNEESRIAAEKEALRQEQARLAAEAKKLKEEKARVAAEAKQLADEEERELQLRIALEQEALRQEQARLAAEAKKLKEEKARVEAEEKRLLADSEREKQLILALEQEVAAQKRKTAEQEAAKQARIAAEKEAAEQARIAAEQAAAEQARLAAEQAAAEQARLAAEEQKRMEEQARLEAERKRKAQIAAVAAAEKKRKADLAARQAAEEKRLAELAAQQADEEELQQELALQQAELDIQLRKQAQRDAASNPYANVSGKYRPEEGFEELTLLQIGDRVNGEVGTRGSTIEGRREGNKITFVLKYSRTGYGFKEGFGQFTVSRDGRRLTGFRSEAGFPANSAWNFTRRFD